MKFTILNRQPAKVPPNEEPYPITWSMTDRKVLGAAVLNSIEPKRKLLSI